MLEQGCSKTEIGNFIRKHKSIICREIARAKDQCTGEYKCELAERKYRQRQERKHKHVRFTNAIKQKVDDHLLDDYSPEQK